MPYSRIVARDMPGGPPRSMHPFGETAENLTRDVWPAGAVEDHIVGQARLPGNGRPALSAGLPEVLLVRSQSCLQHVRPVSMVSPEPKGVRRRRCPAASCELSPIWAMPRAEAEPTVPAIGPNWRRPRCPPM